MAFSRGEVEQTQELPLERRMNKQILSLPLPLSLSLSPSNNLIWHNFDMQKLSGALQILLGTPSESLPYHLRKISYKFQSSIKKFQYVDF